MSALINSLIEQVNRMASASADITATLSSYLTRVRAGFKQYRDNIQNMDIVFFKNGNDFQTSLSPVKQDQDGCWYLPAPSVAKPYFSVRYAAVAYCLAYVDYANETIQNGGTPNGPPPFCNLTKNDDGTYKLNGLFDDSLDPTLLTSYDPFVAVANADQIVAASLVWGDALKKYRIILFSYPGGTYNSDYLGGKEPGDYYKDSSGNILSALLTANSLNMVSTLRLDFYSPVIHIEYANNSNPGSSIDSYTVSMFMAAGSDARSQSLVMKEAVGGGIAYGTLSAALYSNHSVWVAAAPTFEEYPFALMEMPITFIAGDGMVATFGMELYKPAVRFMFYSDTSGYPQNESDVRAILLPIGLSSCPLQSS